MISLKGGILQHTSDMIYAALGGGGRGGGGGEEGMVGSEAVWGLEARDSKLKKICCMSKTCPLLYSNLMLLRLGRNPIRSFSGVGSGFFIKIGSGFGFFQRSDPDSFLLKNRIRIRLQNRN